MSVTAQDRSLLARSAIVTPEDVESVALGQARLQLAPETIEKLTRARRIVDQIMTTEQLVYGLNTGMGRTKDYRIPSDAMVEYQQFVLRLTSGGVGDFLSDSDSRAVMFVRIVGMIRGGSGVTVDVLRALVEMLNAGVCPLIPEEGGLGAGDIMQMAAIGEVMLGRGWARYRDKIMTGEEALKHAGLQPCKLLAKDANAIIVSNAFSVALAARTLLRAERLAELADTVCALMLEVIGGNLSPFDAEVAKAKPVPGQENVAKHIRQLLEGSYLLEHQPISVQDPLSFRVVPQVHGALREVLKDTRAAVEQELAAMDDNPLVSVSRNTLFSTGNFHPMLLALAFESARLALAHVGILSERRINKLLWPQYRSKPDVYEAEGGIELPYPVINGVMFAAAGVLSELKHLANPVSLVSPPVDGDTDDHLTGAPLAVRLTSRALFKLETLLAIEVLLAHDTLIANPKPRMGRGTESLMYATGNALRAIRARGAPIAMQVNTIRESVFAASGTQATDSTSVLMRENNSLVL